MFFYFSLIILILSFGASWYLSRRSLSIKLRNYEFLRIYELKLFKYIFYFSIAAIFSLAIYYSYQQYIVWESASPSKYLLPPYMSLNYFFQYVGFKIFGPYLVSLIFSFLTLFFLKNLNKKYEEKFFYSEEPYAAALAIFLSGHPGWFFYFSGLIIVYLLTHIFITFYNRLFLRRSFNEIRVSLRYWWIPLAIIAIIISSQLQGLELWKLLKI